MKNFKKLVEECRCELNEGYDSGIWVTFNDVEDAKRILTTSDFEWTEQKGSKLLFPEDPETFDALKKDLVRFFQSRYIKYGSIYGEE